MSRQPHASRSQVDAKRVEKPVTRDPLEEEDEIYSFWGQLWSFPKSHPPRGGARVRVKGRENLVWIHRDLWQVKSFEASDCFPVGESDVWDKPASKLSFAEI